jgi:hypothetical protein
MVALTDSRLRRSVHLAKSRDQLVVRPVVGLRKLNRASCIVSVLKLKLNPPGARCIIGHFDAACENFAIGHFDRHTV